MAYEVTERVEPEIKKTGLRCPDCGNHDIERSFWCVWDITEQKWYVDTNTEEDDYCNNCGERIEADEYYLDE